MARAIVVLSWLSIFAAATNAQKNGESDYLVCVSLERASKVALIDGGSGKVVGEIPVGKRPRGIHGSEDGTRLYVALSGSPIQGPPKLDPQGNPIFEADDEEEADHAADVWSDRRGRGAARSTR